MILTRRDLISGAAAFLAAPTIIRVATLMPIRVQPKLYWAKYSSYKEQWYIYQDSSTAPHIEQALGDVTLAYYSNTLCDMQFAGAAAS